MKRINNAALFSQPPMVILSRVPILVEVTVYIYIYISVLYKKNNREGC